MAGVSVGDDGGEVVDFGARGLVGEEGGSAFFVLAAVVVELGADELIACLYGVGEK